MGAAAGARFHARGLPAAGKGQGHRQGQGGKTRNAPFPTWKSSEAHLQLGFPIGY